MEKINHLKELSAIYKQLKRKISLIEVPELQFLMIDGSKTPNENPDYADSVAALYKVAYTLKFMVKRGSIAIDYKVMPLEGLWWAEDMSAFNLENRDNWKWTMMIMQPKFIKSDMFTFAVEESKKKTGNSKLDMIRLETLTEGLSMQIFHLGPYGEAERETINKLHAHISSKGYSMRGKHHEIYVNSPRRTTPENLKTIIRQPVSR